MSLLTIVQYLTFQAKNTLTCLIIGGKTLHYTVAFDNDTSYSWEACGTKSESQWFVDVFAPWLG
eukprot:1505039-Amphidinium_carterae.1